MHGSFPSEASFQMNRVAVLHLHFSFNCCETPCSLLVPCSDIFFLECGMGTRCQKSFGYLSSNIYKYSYYFKRLRKQDGSRYASIFFLIYIIYTTTCPQCNSDGWEVQIFNSDTAFPALRQPRRCFPLLCRYILQHRSALPHSHLLFCCQLCSCHFANIIKI